MNTISGPTCMMIYEYNNKMYYFFGDVHWTRKGGCHEQGIKCDGFNATFTETNDAKTNCTTIGALLYNWLRYNNKHNIRTDFYLEQSYTKENERPSIKEYVDIMRKGQKTGAFKDHSWMELTTYIMQPCFIRDKNKCPFYPNVHAHYIDVRTVETLEGLIEITPFSTYIIIDYIHNNQPKTMDDFNVLKKTVMDYIQFIKNNFKEMIKLLLSDKVDEYKKLVSQLPIYNDRIDLLTSNNKFKVSKQLSKLFLKDKELYKKLLVYIYHIGERIDKNIELHEQLHKNIKVNYDELISMVNSYEDLFIDMQSILMDVYTLARMFTQDGEEIIVYAGYYHIHIYSNFFNLFTKPLLEIKNKIDKSCIKDDRIPLYIDIQKYKNDR